MVFIPFVSTFEKRKGGGGGKSSGGGGSKSGGSSSSSGSKSSGSGSKGTPSFKPTIAGSTRTTSMYGNGGGKAITIPANQPFAGRQAGGATRSQVYGTPYYGSGYPFYATGGYHGVAGRGFPFFFWPIVWGTTAGLGAAYLWASIAEYGPPGSGNRPGGVEVMLMIQDPTKNQTYHLIADSETANAMISPLTTSCPQIGNKPLGLAPFDGSNGQPKPEQTIQYYRASSVALTLQGYNNTAVFTENENGTKPADPLPPGIDTGFLTCINTTIGAAVPLVDASVALQTHAFWMLCVAMLVGLRNSL